MSKDLVRIPSPVLVEGERGEVRVPLNILALASAWQIQQIDRALARHLRANPGLRLLTYEDVERHERVFAWGPREDI